MARNKKKKKKMSSPITPRTALEASIISMCRQPIHLRIYMMWVIFTARHATPNGKSKPVIVVGSFLFMLLVGYAFSITIQHHFLG